MKGDDPVETLQRLERAAVLTDLVEELRTAGSWSGDDHLQAAICLLQTAGRVPLGYTFLVWKESPHSFDLADDLDRMQALGVLKLETRPFPNAPSFAAGPRARSLRERFTAIVSRYGEQAKTVAAAVSDKDVVELERLATASYVLEQTPSHDRDSLLKELLAVSPHTSEDDARAALAAVDDLLRAMHQPKTGTLG